jgi:hypothetical protein
VGEDVDVAVPYAAGELLARVRERGTVDLEYGKRDVGHGSLAPGSGSRIGRRALETSLCRGRDALSDVVAGGFVRRAGSGRTVSG